jgi:hypothetical protein
MTESDMEAWRRVHGLTPAFLGLSLQEAFGGCISVEIYRSDRSLYRRLDIFTESKSGPGPYERLEWPTDIFHDKKLYVAVLNPDKNRQGPLSYSVTFAYEPSKPDLPHILLENPWVNPRMIPGIERMGDPPNERYWIRDPYEFVVGMKNSLSVVAAEVHGQPREQRMQMAALQELVGQVAAASGLDEDAVQLLTASAQTYRTCGAQAEEAGVLQQLQGVYTRLGRTAEVKKISSRLKVIGVATPRQPIVGR